MDKKQKIFIGIGVFIFIILIGFIGYKFLSTPSLEDQSKDKSSDSKPALETNIDNESNEENVKEEKQKQQKSKEKKDKEDKSNEKDKKNEKENKSKKNEEPKKKPDKKDLEKKAKRFVEIQTESKTPENVKSLKSDMEKVATKSLTNKLFGEHMSSDEDSNLKAKVTKTTVAKNGKTNAQVDVLYNVSGKSPESKKQETLKEDIKQSMFFKYEDGQYKVDRYKQ